MRYVVAKAKASNIIRAWCSVPALGALADNQNLEVHHVQR
jgi:hypothetical protein